MDSINGDHDPRVPFNGMAEGTRINGRLLPALESADYTFGFFADHAHCSAIIRTENLPDVNPADGSTAEKRVRGSCSGGTTSTQYVMHNAGHAVPGLTYSPESVRSRGGVNMDVDAGTVIWDHFQRTLHR